MSDRARDETAGTAARQERDEEPRITQFLIEHSADPVLWVTPDARFTYVNQAACSLLGYEREELLSMTVHDLVPTFSAVPNAEIWEEVKRRGSWTFETVGRTKDGRLLPVEVRCFYLKHRGTEYNLACVRDLSERRALEDRLRQAEKMEAVGRLAGGIAHDFNNMLTVITGFSELALADLRPDDPLWEDLKLVHEAGEKAAALTRQLLGFSRQQVLQPQILDLNHSVTEFQPLLERTIREDIEISTVLDPAIGRVEADPGQIGQVLLNLAVNARDAMPDGGKLTIETAEVELDDAYAADHVAVTPGRYVMLAVSDTGAGMDEDTRSRIFEPFFTTKAKGEGTGFGLATVYDIVKQNGGYIWLYSEPGEGATFKIYLPRVEEATGGARREETAGEPERGSETVLVVEDDELVREFAARTLRDRGYRVLLAADPEEALRICSDLEGPIDLLITDLVMRGGTGVELAEKIGQIEPGARTLFISGYAEMGVVRSGRLEKHMEFLGKPFGASALVRKVRGVLNKRVDPDD